MSQSSRGAVGATDRTIRFALGFAFVLFPFVCPWAAAQGPAVQIAGGLFGAVLLATAWLRACPIYRALGLCTDRA